MDNMMQDIVQLFSSFPFHIKDLAPSYHVLHQVGQVCANLALFEVNVDLTHLHTDLLYSSSGMMCSGHQDEDRCEATTLLHQPD